MSTTITQHHADLLAKLLNEKPHRIVGGKADPSDAYERRTHVEQITRLFGAYLVQAMGDLNENLPFPVAADHLHNFQAQLSEIVDEHLGGPIGEAAEKLVDDRYEDAPRQPMFARHQHAPKVL